MQPRALISIANSTPGISRFKFVGLTYLTAVLSYSIANSVGGNVQNFYRIPLVNVRWIDVAILLVICNFFVKLTGKLQIVSRLKLLVPLCFIYLIFESFQLARSWGLHDAESQLSHFLCTLGLFIVIDLCTFTLPRARIVSFIKGFSKIGAVVSIISNFYLIYAFYKGNIVFEDLDIRVALEVVGSKETVYPFVLTPLVYAFGLYYLKRPSGFWIKILFSIAIVSIYSAAAITFHRGTLAALLIITLYFVFSSKRLIQSLLKLFGIFVLLALFYLVFGNLLSEKGYDPIQKIIQTAEFATDVHNPEWDKGRSGSQQYAIKAWHQNFWFGAGYDELLHYGLPEGVATAHNGFITSLFHRGLIGTILLMTIFFLLFRNCFKLWHFKKFESSDDREIMKLLIVVCYIWIITFMTQEALWEKYSLCIEYLYLGLVTNYLETDF